MTRSTTSGKGADQSSTSWIGSEDQEPLLRLLASAATAAATGAAAPGDGIGGGEVLGDELPRPAAPDLQPHALRLVHLVVARRRLLPAAGPAQLLLDAVHQPRQLPHIDHRRRSSEIISLHQIEDRARHSRDGALAFEMHDARDWWWKRNDDEELAAYGMGMKPRAAAVGVRTAGDRSMRGWRKLRRPLVKRAGV